MSVNTNTLESMCELIVDCPHSTPKWTDEGVVVLRNQNIKNGTLNLDSPSFTNEDGYQARVKRAIPQAGDIVFTREAPMGEVCMIPEGLKCCLGQRQVLLRPKDSVCGEYLFWALQSPFVQHQISWNEGTGSTVSNVRIPVLKALNIPRLPQQEEGIAKVLSDLANKIRVNRQTNQTLEQIAQAIFKSWFVDFDPTRAKIAAKEEWARRSTAMDGGNDENAGAIFVERAAMCAISGKTLEELEQLAPEQIEQLRSTAALFPDTLVDSELGEIPKGWEVNPISKMVELIGGGTPKKSEEQYWNGNIPWFSVKDSPAQGDVFVIDTELKITELGLNKSSTKLLPEGVTIISARGTVGRLALVGIPTAMNQSCYGVKGINGTGAYLNYFNLKEAVSTLQQNTHGAVFDTITRDTFETALLVDAPEYLKKQFESSITASFEQIKANLFESGSLQQLRDTLLPKLLTGELIIEPQNNNTQQEPLSV